MSLFNEQKFPMKIENSDEAEITFADDETCDINEQRFYDENSWPTEDPSGFSFKGKKELSSKLSRVLKF